MNTRGGRYDTRECRKPILVGLSSAPDACALVFRHLRWGYCDFRENTSLVFRHLETRGYFPVEFM